MQRGSRRSPTEALPNLGPGVGPLPLEEGGSPRAQLGTGIPSHPTAVEGCSQTTWLAESAAL